MTEINNANVSLEYNLNNYDDPNEVDDLYHVVVQKGNVGSSYVYALQLLHKGTNIYVFRGNRQKDVAFDKNNPVLRLIGQDGNTAGGHTQTWNMLVNQEIGWWGLSLILLLKNIGQLKLRESIFQMEQKSIKIQSCHACLI